jgi:hypothetical protein
MDMRFYVWARMCNGVREWGTTTGATPREAMSKVLGSHPQGYGITYANVYNPELPDNHEWFMHPPARPQDHVPMRAE